MKGLYLNREGSLNGADIELRTPPSQQASPNNETGQSNTFRSMSVSLGQNHPSKLVNPGQDLPRTMSVPVRITVLSSPDGTGGVSAPWSRMGREGSSDYWDGISKRSPSQASGFSTCSSGDMAGEVNEDGLESRASPLAKQALHHSSPPSVLVCAKLSQGKIYIYVMDHVYISKFMFIFWDYKKCSLFSIMN